MNVRMESRKLYKCTDMTCVYKIMCRITCDDSWSSSDKLKWNESGFRPSCANIGWTGPGEPPEDGEMIEMTLSSRHKIRNGGLRPSTLPLDHGGSPQYWLKLWQTDRRKVPCARHVKCYIERKNDEINESVSKHETVTQCWCNVGPASQDWTVIGSTTCVCWNFPGEWEDDVGRTSSITHATLVNYSKL